MALPLIIPKVPHYKSLHETLYDLSHPFERRFIAFGILTDDIEHSRQNGGLEESAIVFDEESDQNIVISKHFCEKMNIVEIIFGDGQFLNNS
jgi:hypothetical protein